MNLSNQSHTICGDCPPSQVASPQLDAALRRIRPDVRAMRAYHVAPSEGLIKLDAMENPYRLDAALQHELGQRLGAVALNRYPGQQVQQLMQRLGDWVGLPEGCALLLGNGSDELITLLALAVSSTVVPGAYDGSVAAARPVVIAPVPSFVMYPMSAALLGLDFVGVSLCASDFALDVPAMTAAIAVQRPAIVWLPAPNNPTATLWAVDAMQAVIDAAAQVGAIVVVDEAYQPFADRSWIEFMRADPQRNAHVLLMRTLSKFGLAGIRLGYLVGAAALVQEIDKVRPPYNISVLNCEAALFALDYADVFAAQAQAIRAERSRLLQALPMIGGVQQVWPSQANMVLLRVRDATATHAALLRQGILIKNMHGSHPLLEQCLRLTVGTPEENTRLLAALQTAL